jgi:hypothetical protein
MLRLWVALSFVIIVLAVPVREGWRYLGKKEDS